MRNLKKVLALVVAFSMMLSVVAFASFNDVADDADYAGAVELLSALEIIVGDENGNFNPDKTISRAEMAAIVCRIKGLESAAKGAKGETKFSDVAADHWASGYVNTAEKNGIVSGYGDGTFGPEDEVTYEQAVRMIVSALGFDPMAAQKGGWPTGYLVVANTYKISEGVSGSTRADVAVLVYNALNTPMMDQTTYGADAEFEILDGKKDRDYRTLLTDMDIYVATGIVMETEADEVFFIVTEDSDDGEFEEDDEEYFEINGSNIADYQFQNVDVYVEKNARKDYLVVAVVPSVLGETFALISDDVKAASKTAVEYYVDSANSSKTKEIKLEVGTIVYNKQNVTDEMSVADICALDDVELVFIENTGDTKYDVLVAVKYTSELLEFVDADKEKMTLGGYTVDFDFDDEDKTYVFADDAGNELTLADFAEDDVIAFYADDENPKNADFIKVIKLSNAAVEGIVEEAFTSNGDDYIVVDGEELKVDGSEEADGSIKSLGVGDEGIFYVGMTGKVIYFDGSAAGQNYAYILEAELSDSAFAADLWQIKLLTKDQGVVIFDTTEDGSEDYEAIFGDKATTWDDETTAANLSEKRLITYKTNAKGEIKSMEKATDAENSDFDASINSTYNGKTQIIQKKTLEDDVIIFLINENKADNTSVAGLSYLVDDSDYAGAIYTDEDGECAVMIVTAGDSAFNAEIGLAIVTKITDTKDAEDNDVIKVSYVQDEAEGSVIFDEDSSSKTADDVEDLGIGSVFAFNATADGVVSNYAVIAHINNKDALELADGVNDTLIKALFDDETELVFGYIENDKRNTNSKGELITVGDEAYVVTKASNKYTYNDAGRNTVIETEDFLAEDAYYFDAENKEYTPVLIYTYEGAVLDIYTSTERQTLGE